MGENEKLHAMTPPLGLVNSASNGLEPRNTRSTE